VFDQSGKFLAKWTNVGAPWGLYYVARENAIYMDQIEFAITGASRLGQCFRSTRKWPDTRTLPNAVLHRVRTSAQPENHFGGSPSIRSFPREWVKLRLEHSLDLSPTRLRVLSRVLTKLEMRILPHKLSLNRDVITFL
jgi:hypothetical protein